MASLVPTVRVSPGRGALLRATLVLLLLSGAGAMLGQVTGPTPVVSDNPIRIGNPPPPPPQDPWFVRYAALIVLLGGGVITLWAKARIIDPMREDFLKEAVAVRGDLKEEGAARREALVMLSSSFKEALAEMRGTVAGLGEGVRALGPAIMSISTAAGEVAKSAAALSKDHAVAEARRDAQDDRLTRLEEDSRK